MQDLQCFDVLVNFFETETDRITRQLIFELIFCDLFYNSNDLNVKNNNNLLATFISYSISVQSKNTLDLFTIWYQTNLATNEELLTNSLFNTIMYDHFLLQKNSDFDSLAQNLPSFVSFFLTLTLNAIIKPLEFKNLIILNFLKVLNSCLKINYQLLNYCYGNNPFQVNNH